MCIDMVSTIAGRWRRILLARWMMMMMMFDGCRVLAPSAVTTMMATIETGCIAHTRRHCGSRLRVHATAAVVDK